jgi:hypothetical protein
LLTFCPFCRLTTTSFDYKKLQIGLLNVAVAVAVAVQVVGLQLLLNTLRMSLGGAACDFQ